MEQSEETFIKEDMKAVLKAENLEYEIYIGDELICHVHCSDIDTFQKYLNCTLSFEENCSCASCKKDGHIRTMQSMYVTLDIFPERTGQGELFYCAECVEKAKKKND